MIYTKKLDGPAWWRPYTGTLSVGTGGVYRRGREGIVRGHVGLYRGNRWFSQESEGKMESEPSWLLSRKEFLRRTGLAVLAAGAGGTLVGCATDDGGSASSGEGGGSQGGVGPATLNYLGWEGYDGTPAAQFSKLSAWEKEHKIKLLPVYIQGNTEIPAKIQASSAGSFDLTTPYHGLLPSMVLADLLEPLEVDRLKNWNSIIPQLRGQEYLRGKDGRTYGVPFTFSQEILLYNADRVEPFESYRAVLDDPDLKDRYTLKDVPENFIWIAKTLGLGNPDPTLLTKDELEECQAVARQVVAKARSLSQSLGDMLQLLVSNAVDYSLSGTPDQPQKAQEQGVNIEAFFPKEGTQSFVDNYSIVKGAEDFDAALAWIDEMLAPGPQSEVAAVFGGAVVNPKAVSMLKPDLKKLYDYDSVDTFFDRAPVYSEIPSEGDRFATYQDWVNAWSQVK